MSMDLNNATLLRIDTPNVPTTGGDVSFANGSAISFRCILDEPNFEVQRTIEQAKLDVTMMLYVQLSKMPGAPAQLITGVLLTVAQDGLSPRTFRVERAGPKIFGGVSHVRCFLKAM